MRAALHALYHAQIAARSFCGAKERAAAPIFDLMDAVHEVPQILLRWGTQDNDEQKLRQYFGYFRAAKWKSELPECYSPDLVQRFEEMLHDDK